MCVPRPKQGMGQRRVCRDHMFAVIGFSAPLDKNNLRQLLKLSMFELPFLWQTIQLETS